MKERIFNLFYYVNDNAIYELGFVVYLIAGTDAEKSLFLKNSVVSDFEKAERCSLPERYCNIAIDGRLALQYFMALTRQGRAHEVFEDIFSKSGADTEPLCCITAIADGKPEIDISTPLAPLYLSEYQEHPKIGGGVMSDYLEDYLTPNGFDMPSLVNNDYFEAIKLLFNNGHYVSCMKLLVSFIDTIAFLEFGDTRNNFLKWLDEYADLDTLGVSSAQLWELRNSILHMTNLDSRQVLNGKQKRISFCVAKPGFAPEEDFETKYFNLLDLINVVANALSKWIALFNANPDKFTTFIERYDRVISDDRHGILLTGQ